MRTAWIVNHYAHHRSRDGRATRHQCLAESLPRSGWHAVVITSATDHPTGRSHMHGLRLRERLVHEASEFCWLRGIDHRGRGFRRALLRLGDIALFTVMLLTPGMFRGLPRPDVVVGSSFHPLAAWGASVLARRFGVPFVFEPRDLWPESAIGLAGMREGHIVVRALRRIERTTVRRSAHIVSPLDGVGRYYAERGYGGPFTWVPNGIDTDHVEPKPADAHAGQDTSPEDHHDTFTVTYIGSMGPANALETVVDGFDIAYRSAAAAGGPPLTLRLVGDGPDREALRERVSRLQAENRVTWDGRVPQGVARTIGRRAGCLVVSMRDLPLYRYGISLNKQYEYMLMGRPLLVAGPVALESVVATGSGVHVAPDDPRALADGILALARTPETERAAMGARGRQHVLREHDYRVLAQRYAAALDAASIAGPRSRR